MSYPPNIFSSADHALAIKIIKEVKFANIVFLNNGEIVTVAAPVILDSNNDQISLVGHLVKHNHLWHLIQNNALPCTLIFNAADGYISPKVYNEKAKSGKAVPTWNYVTVQLKGMMHIVDDMQLLDILTRQTFLYEKMVDSSWHLTDAPEEYIDRLKQIIFGFKFIVSEVLVTYKMSQNKSSADIKNIITWLQTKPGRNKDLDYWFDFLNKNI